MLNEDELDLAPEPDEEEEYIQYDIATYPSDYTLSGIQELWHKKDLIVPDFQREFVWSIKQSSLLIESFLMGLPVPPVFFYIDEDNKSLVIDGQQRILSVIFYFEGYFGAETGQGKRQVFRLTGLSEKSPYHNHRFEDLKEADQRKLRGSVLRAVNIKQLAPRANNSSVYHIFERLNTGGTALKPQEIRNCVYRGPIVGSLRSLNKEKHWRELLGKNAPDRYQRDVELVLRLFALFGDWEKYEKPWIKLRRLCLVRGRENVPRITFVKLAPGTAFVGFPTSFTPPQILGGVKLRRGDIVVHSLGGQTSGASRWGFIAVAQEDLAFYGRPLIGVNLVPPPAMSNLRSPSAAPARLSLLHAQACRVAEAKPEIIVHREVERALEDDLPQRAPSAA